MGDSNRRDFIKVTALGLSVQGLLPNTIASPATQQATPLEEIEEIIKTHSTLELNGLHAYANPINTSQGGELKLCVSSDKRYSLKIYRVIDALQNPNQDPVETIYANPTTKEQFHPVNQQPIRPGSYCHIGKRLTQEIDALSIECWVRPLFDPCTPSERRYCGILTQYDYWRHCGFGLFFRPLKPCQGKPCPPSPCEISFYLGIGRE
jgi:hypothetical protein